MEGVRDHPLRKGSKRGQKEKIDLILDKRGYIKRGLRTNQPMPLTLVAFDWIELISLDLSLPFCDTLFHKL
jgi:hypothetical protein